MKTDLIVLAVVVAGLACLVALALLGLALLPRPQEMTDDTPEAVVYNYYLALENGECEKAYAYLSQFNRASTPPDEFCQWTIERTNSNRLSRVECREEQVHSNWAFVTVRFTYSYGSSPLRRYEYSSERTVKLVREEGEWRIRFSSPFFYR